MNHHAEKKSSVGAAQNFFVYLVSFLALGFLVFGWGGIVFQFINKFFPDPLLIAYQGIYDQDAVKFGIASVFVALPIFLLVSTYIIGQLRQGGIAEESKVRKWLTFIVLFFASATAISDLISILFNFLGGEITVRFVLKALVIMLIALAVFGYYFWDMRKKHMLRKVYPLNLLSAEVLIGVVAIVFVAAFFLIDKPSVAREKKVDQNALTEMQNVDDSLRGYFEQKDKLPENLEEMAKTNFAVNLMQGSSLEYQKTSETTFNLCAVFKRSNADQFTINGRIPDGSLGSSWQHEAGKVCFERLVVRSENAQNPVKSLK